MGVYLVDYLADNPNNHIVVTSRSKHDSERTNVQFILGNFLVEGITKCNIVAT